MQVMGLKSGARAFVCTCLLIASVGLASIGWTHQPGPASNSTVQSESGEELNVQSCGIGCSQHTIRPVHSSAVGDELEQIEAINLEVHEALHEHGEPGFMNQTKAWLRGLNVLDFAMRSSLLDRKGRVAGSDHFQNLLAILVVTHGIEFAFGPVSVSTAVAMDAPAWVIGGLTTVGAVISIPMFLDPLCWAAYAAYCTSPKFRKTVSNVRGFVLSWRKTKDPFEGAVHGVQELQRQGLVPQGVQLWEKTVVNGREVGLQLEVTEDSVRVAQMTLTPSDVPIWTERELESYPWSFRRAFRKILSNRGDGLIERQDGSVYTLKAEMFALKKQECLTLLSGTSK